MTDKRKTLWEQVQELERQNEALIRKVDALAEELWMERQHQHHMAQRSANGNGLHR